MVNKGGCDSSAHSWDVSKPQALEQNITEDIMALPLPLSVWTTKSSWSTLSACVLNKLAVPPQTAGGASSLNPMATQLESPLPLEINGPSELKDLMKEKTT